MDSKDLMGVVVVVKNKQTNLCSWVSPSMGRHPNVGNTGHGMILAFSIEPGIVWPVSVIGHRFRISRTSIETVENREIATRGQAGASDTLGLAIPSLPRPKFSRPRLGFLVY